MCQQQATRCTLRIVLARAEDEVVADSISQRVYCTGRFRSLVVRMNPYLAEVVPEARLHEGTRRRVERLARRPQHFVHDWRHGGRTGGAARPPMQAQAVLLAVLALSFQTR
jgi:hypothetical protein